MNQPSETDSLPGQMQATAATPRSWQRLLLWLEIDSTLITKMKHPYKFISIAVLTISSCSLPATQLYNLGFTTNDFGIYQTSGNPSVQASVGPFTDALVFHAVTFQAGIGYDQIQLPFEATVSRYDIQFDVLTHNLLNSQYAFFLYLDTPQIPYVYFHGGQNRIGAFQPFPYTIANLAAFTDDHPYHFDISVDLQANLWSIAIDGTYLFDSPVNASSLDAIRFSLQPWTGGAVDAPTTFAALDNVVVSVVPEPSVFCLLIVAGVAGSSLRWWKEKFILCRLTPIKP
jgi:hypothetical protein